MKLSITVGSHAERDALNRTLDDPILRASMVVAGILLDVDPSDRARILDFAQMTLNTNGHAPTPGPMRLTDGSSGD